MDAGTQEELEIFRTRDSDDDDAFDDNDVDDDDDDDTFETDGPGAAVNGQLRAMSQPVAKEVAT